MQGFLNQHLVRIGIFLFSILIITVFIYPVLQTAFLSNIYINLIIVFSLIGGLIFCIYNLARLNSDYKILAHFNIHKTPQVFLQSSVLLKNLSPSIKEIEGR